MRRDGPEVENTGCVDTWVVSWSRRAASAPCICRVAPVVLARVSATAIGSGMTRPTKRLISGRTKTPRATRVMTPDFTSRESV
jgi:hypothetical protein